ncbi:hypothetical protein L207DRAFT_575484 [Hyaloscypha variabilis F]|uniref:2EXR domain-containing protein n=1 Tax=Hyaloscypha variabilis (strain UAMH 11265 / GT02V1 / F) TaxID=1149755 RepID=A0A2J6SDI9_HYAVF|nr:hypothetical protein L207DRAFT_575484 [Hyaloscypha variabilis F]
MASIPMSSLSLGNQAAPKMTLFQKFPPEVRNMVWKFSVLESEIISIEVIRHIVSEKTTGKKKKVDGDYIPRQFSIRYEAFGIPCFLDGNYITRHDGKDFSRSGQLGACKHSRSIYLQAKPNFLRLFKTGHKIWFHAKTDTICIPRRTRFNLNQLRQRQRPKMVFFTGFEHIKRVVFEEEQDEETAMEVLSDQILTDFTESILELEEDLFERHDANYSKDDGWTDAVDLEQEVLTTELKRAGLALTKVNGTAFSTGVSEQVKVLFFPLIEQDLEDEVEVKADGEEGEDAN